MDALEQKDFINKDTRVNLLENKLVLVVPENSSLALTSFTDITSDDVKKVAIGDPASVPAGQYAQTAFESLKIWDQVQAKANLGSDVRQVLTWVETGNVDCGFVYSTDAATSQKIKVVCEAPEGSINKIIYPVSVLKSSPNTDAAKAFITYLQTGGAAAIFEKFGVSMA